MAVRRIALALAAAGILAGCGSTEATLPTMNSGPNVVAATTWEGGIAKAAGAIGVKVIVSQAVGHAPDYDPKPSDLAAVADADFVLYAPFESFAGKIKEAAGSKAKLVEVNLDNSKDKLAAEVTRLAEMFGTQEAAKRWNAGFETEYKKLAGTIKAAWPSGKQPTAISQVFVTHAAELAGAEIIGTYGPEPVSPSKLAEMVGKNPQFIFDNAHMSAAGPGTSAEHVAIVNYPGDDLDMLKVFTANADKIVAALR
jgi:zinc transport system substrate-binding protein